MTANEEQARFWESRAAVWDRRATLTEAFSDVYGAPALERLAPAPGERIVDLGCGPGTTTIELARRVAPDGEAVGVDIANGMIESARRRAEAAHVDNVRFLIADAQVDDLGDPETFDGAYSRFGVMFFGDPVAAFRNVRRALRPGGRLSFACWSELEHNPWMSVPTMAAVQALSAELPPPPGPGQPGPFSLADPDRVRQILGDSGFVDIGVEPLAGHRPIPAEAADEAIRLLLEVGPVSEAFAAADEAARERTVQAVIDACKPFRVADGGYELPGRALLVTARAGRTG